MSQGIQDLNQYKFYLHQYRIFEIRKDSTYKELTIKKQQKLKELLKNKKAIFVKNKHRFYYMNPISTVSIIETILMAASAFGLSKQNTFPFTILHRSWHTTLEALEGDFEKYFNLNMIRGRIYNAFQGKDYFGFIELAFLEGNVLAIHFHGILWSVLTEAEEAHINSCFEGGEKENHNGFDVSPTKDMIKAFSYLVKPPVSEYRSSSQIKKHVRLGKKKCKRLAIVMKKHNITYFDMIVAAGAGKEFKAAVVRHLKEHV